MKTFKTIIIDDERLAREEVKRALKSYPEFEVIGEASHVDEAKKMIEEMIPDIIFLDIHMPGKSGFDLLEELTTVPEVVFTTAYDQYAVKAFELNALDYLVKPLRDERFAKTIEKVKIELAEKVELKSPNFTNASKDFYKRWRKMSFHTTYRNLFYRIIRKLCTFIFWQSKSNDQTFFEFISGKTRSKSVFPN